MCGAGEKQQHGELLLYVHTDSQLSRELSTELSTGEPESGLCWLVTISGETLDTGFPSRSTIGRLIIREEAKKTHYLRWREQYRSPFGFVADSVVLQYGWRFVLQRQSLGASGG